MLLVLPKCLPLLCCARGRKVVCTTANAEVVVADEPAACVLPVLDVTISGMANCHEDRDHLVPSFQLLPLFDVLLPSKRVIAVSTLTWP